MGDIIDLNDRTKPFEDDLEFISDLARYAEGIFSEQDVKKKHHLSADTWERLGNNDLLAVIAMNKPGSDDGGQPL